MKPSHIFLLALSLNILSPVAYAATVNVRTGIHDRYNRIVFDWPTKVEFDLKQEDNQVTVTFTGQKDTQIKAQGLSKLPLIRDFTTRLTANGLVASFQIPDHSKIESFREGGKTVFDVLKMDTAAPKFPAQQSAAKEKETVKPHEKIKETPKQVLQPPAEDMPQTLADRLVEKPSETELQKPGQESTPQPTEAAAATITYDVGQPTKLAVFTRGQHLWVVVDKIVKNILPALGGTDQALLLGEMQTLSAENGTAFVFDIKASDVAYGIVNTKTAWKIALNPKQLSPELDELTLTHNDAGLALLAGDNPQVIQLSDPFFGDRLWAVPMRALQSHASNPRDFAQLGILPSVIGAAIIPHSDTLQAQTVKDTVVFSDRKTGLALSNDKDRALGVPEIKRLPPFRLSENEQKLDFYRQREAQETAILAEKDPAAKAHMIEELARIHVTNGFGIEGLGLLRVAQDMSPGIEKETDFVALHAMASALASHEKEAQQDLSDGRMQSMPIARMWLGYVQAINQKWADAATSFADSGNAEDGLPESLRHRVVLAKAETFFETGNIKAADKQLAKVKSDKDFLPSDKAAFDYLNALLDLKEHPDESLPILQQLANGQDQMYRVKAELELVSLQLKNKEITLDKAIEALERLRFSWRGDALETQIMHELGQYYIDAHQYMEGLTTWRQAASLKNSAQETDKITKDMQDVFNALFVDNGIKDISPIRAVALFDRFRELTPPGKQGDLAVMHLADRLASADLADQADAILLKQLQSQPNNENGPLFGAKMASWRLLNRDGAGALKILDDTAGNATMPEELSQRRLLLRARALADNGQTDEALSLLDALQTPEALSLRADINWRQSRWPYAVEALQTLVLHYRDKGQDAPDGPMPPLILKMAIAMTLDDNKKGMELLVAQYGDFMSKTSRAETFNLITKSSRGSSLADVDTLTKQVGEVELFQKFLKDFGS